MEFGNDLLRDAPEVAVKIASCPLVGQGLYIEEFRRRGHVRIMPDLKWVYAFLRLSCMATLRER